MKFPNTEHANAHFVTAYLAVGGDLNEHEGIANLQALELAALGITHVLDARLEASDADVWGQMQTVDYRWNGINDAGQTVPAAWFEETVVWALSAIEQGGKVLTHCHMGINRGPSAGFAILLAMGWDPIEALTAIRAARPIAYMSYAEDALEWYFQRTGATAIARRVTCAAVATWRQENPLDVVRVIRNIRRGEAA